MSICLGYSLIAHTRTAHLAHSTPPELLLCSTDFNSYGPKRIAKTTAHRKNGKLAAPVEPGLGIEPIFDELDFVCDFVS